jgi:predicted TIM-barrel fold metal-dependent hydrolase
MIDVNTFLGGYPFRRVPGTTTEALLASMERLGIGEAWVSHLPAIFWRDPTEGNSWLYETTAHESRFRPVPSVEPGLANWESELAVAVERNAPAVRVDPTVHGLDPVGMPMRRLGAACAEAGVPLMLAVRFEDGRQRHPIDQSGELPAAAVRALVRSDPRTRVLVTHADRGFIEETHWSLTPEESSRIWWDICWIWGPPEDHLQLLIETIGPARFVLGTGMPLRIPETPIARLDLLDLSPADRAAIDRVNAEALGRKPA